MQNNESDILKEWKATKGRETQRIKKKREREEGDKETGGQRETVKMKVNIERSIDKKRR